MEVLIDGIRYVPDTETEERPRTQLETALRQLEAVDGEVNWVGSYGGGIAALKELNRPEENSVMMTDAEQREFAFREYDRMRILGSEYRQLGFKELAQARDVHYSPRFCRGNRGRHTGERVMRNDTRQAPPPITSLDGRRRAECALAFPSQSHGSGLPGTLDQGVGAARRELPRHQQPQRPRQEI
jgi:hypothetical protein